MLNHRACRTLVFPSEKNTEAWREGRYTFLISQSSLTRCLIRYPTLLPPGALFPLRDFRRAAALPPLWRYHPPWGAPGWKAQCLQAWFPEYSRQRPHSDHYHMPQEEITCEGKKDIDLVNWLFIHFSSFPDKFVLIYCIFSDVEYEVMKSISQSHIIKAASGLRGSLALAEV